MRPASVPLSVVVLSLGITPALRGQVVAREFLDYCTTGALIACASVRVTTESEVFLADGATRTYVHVLARNLQGTLGTPANWQGLYRITLLPRAGAALEGAMNLLRIRADGPVGWQTLSPVSEWRNYEPPPGGMALDAGAYAMGIFGCEPGPTSGLGFQTCDALGYTGWVDFSFEFTMPGGHTPWSASDLGGIGFTVTDGGAGITSVTCNTTDAATCTQVGNVVPEPATIVLLGTGLAGVALRALRKRRDDGCDS